MNPNAVATLVKEKTSLSLAISDEMLSALGTVISLELSFRTASACDWYVCTKAQSSSGWRYDVSDSCIITRYQENGRIWTIFRVASRNLAQVVCVVVNVAHSKI